MRVIASDFHFGREGYETAIGERVKKQSADNLGDFISSLSYEHGQKIPLTIVGDLFHRPHWSLDTARRLGEGFNCKKSAAQIGNLAEVLRRGYAVTLIDGNCDPWESMPESFRVNTMIHDLLLDTREDVDVTFAGLSWRESDVLFTHGHNAEDMGLLMRNALRLPSDVESARVAEKLRSVLSDNTEFSANFAEKDEKGSSLFHHIVCQTLMRLEQLEIGCLDKLLPTAYVRRVGNETLAEVLARASAHAGDEADTAVFGHTHQPGKMNVANGSTTVWNPGSATGDLHVRPYGTFLVQGEHGMEPYYSWHPDCPRKVIPMPTSHLESFSKGIRGTRAYGMGD